MKYCLEDLITELKFNRIPLGIGIQICLKYFILFFQNKKLEKRVLYLLSAYVVPRNTQPYCFHVATVNTSYFENHHCHNRALLWALSCNKSHIYRHINRFCLLYLNFRINESFGFHWKLHHCKRRHGLIKATCNTLSSNRMLHNVNRFIVCFTCNKVSKSINRDNWKKKKLSLSRLRSDLHHEISSRDISIT